MRKLYLIILLALTINTFDINAQIDFSNLTNEQIYNKENKYNTWSVSVGYGLILYYTDVIDYTILPSNNYKFGPSLTLSKQFGRAWGIDGQFMTADMYGQKNNRYFKGNLMDYSLSLRFSINQLVSFGPINDKWDLYGKLGLGVVAFRSRLRALEDDRFLTAGDVHNYLVGYPIPPGWDEDDYLVEGYERNSPDTKKDRATEMIVPIGIGVKYRINKSFDVGFEMNMRSMTSDNLDVNLSGADNDNYMYNVFSLTYKLGKKNKRHARWTYKDFNLDYSTIRQSDPLAIRLDSLKSRLDKIAGLDSVITTKSYQKFEKIIYEEGVSASVFFDYDKSIVKKSEQRQIAKVARALKKDPAINMVISGYCDDRGSNDYNYKLSERRCNAVLSILVEDYSLSPDRFTIDPKGETELLSDTQNLHIKGLHMANRRVDLLMVVEVNTK